MDALIVFLAFIAVMLILCIISGYVTTCEPQQEQNDENRPAKDAPISVWADFLENSHWSVANSLTWDLWDGYAPREVLGLCYKRLRRIEKPYLSQEQILNCGYDVVYVQVGSSADEIKQAVANENHIGTYPKLVVEGMSLKLIGFAVTAGLIIEGATNNCGTPEWAIEIAKSQHSNIINMTDFLVVNTQISKLNDLMKHVNVPGITFCEYLIKDEDGTYYQSPFPTCQHHMKIFVAALDRDYYHDTSRPKFEPEKIKWLGEGSVFLMTKL